MSRLNYLCEHDMSDDDCYRCRKYGLIHNCPKGCEHFKDVRASMSPEYLKLREEIMRNHNLKDKFPIGERP